VQEKVWFMVNVGCPRFIKNIVANNILIGVKPLRYDVPVGHHFIVNAIFVGVKSSEG